jgi:acyl-CoA thioester hydrolase
VSDLPFRWPVRVSYVDTDRGGVVHHGTYMRYFEQARVELLRASGVDYKDLEERLGFALPVHSLDAKYRVPLRFDDPIEVETTVGVCNRAKIRFDYRILREEVVTTEARITCACVRLEDLRIVSMHPLVRAAFG